MLSRGDRRRWELCETGGGGNRGIQEKMRIREAEGGVGSGEIAGVGSRGVQGGLLVVCLTS